MPRKPRRTYPHVVTLYLSDSQRDALRQKAEATSTDQCEVLRQALDRFVAAATGPGIAALDATAKRLNAEGARRMPAALPPGSAPPTGEVVRPLRIWTPPGRR